MGTECVLPNSLEIMKLNKMGLEINGHVIAKDCHDESTCGKEVNGSEVPESGMKCDEKQGSPNGSEIANGVHRRSRWRYKKRHEMTPNELDLARRRDRIQSRRRREKAELKRLENLREHEIKVENANHTSPIAMLDESASQKGIDSEKTNYDSSPSASSATQRLRVIKKRSRSDMSPEELARLRERERKAQQNRRDRIRAQKRQARGWPNDDAAWEAFLNEAEEPVSTGHSPSSHVPSMVGDADEKQFVLEKAVPGARSDQSSCGSHKDVDLKTEQDVEDSALCGSKCENPSYSSEASPQPCDGEMSQVDTASPSSPPSPSNRLVFYSSDEDSKDCSFKDNQAAGQKYGRRHYLPTDELERIRKRERDAKRKQREKARLLTSDKIMPGGTGSFQSSSSHASSGYHSVSPVGSQLEVDTQSRACQSSKDDRSPNFDHANTDAEVPTHNMLSVMTAERSEKYLAQDMHRSESSPTQKKSSALSVGHHEHFRHVNYPVSHHAASTRDFCRHSESLPVSPGTHSTGLVMPPRIQHHSPHHLFHSAVYLTPEVTHMPSFGHAVSAFPHLELPSAKGESPTSRCLLQHPASSSDKKRLISRNVDRKKLSEEELEELRRRERDYQRERRARIRMEKAKSQVSPEKQMPGKITTDDEGKAAFYSPETRFMSPPSSHHRRHAPARNYTAGTPTSNHFMHSIEREEGYTGRYDQRQESSTEEIQSSERRDRHEGSELDVEEASRSIDDYSAQIRNQLLCGNGGERGSRDRKNSSSRNRDVMVELPDRPNEFRSKKADAFRATSTDTSIIKDETHVREIACDMDSTLVSLSGSTSHQAAGFSDANRFARNEAKKNILEHICSSLKGNDDRRSEAHFEAACADRISNENSYNAEDRHDEDYDEDRLVIVQPNIEESMQDDMKRCKSEEMLSDELTKSAKEAPSSASSSQAEEQLSEDKWRYWKEGLTEDQLERRRKSNREAQRRRRARLRMQGIPCDEPAYYEAMIDAPGHNQEPGYFSTNTAKRPDSASDGLRDRRSKLYFEVEMEKFSLHPKMEKPCKSVHVPSSMEVEDKAERANVCQLKMTPSVGFRDLGFDERYSSREVGMHFDKFAYAEPYTPPYIVGDKHSHYSYAGVPALLPPHRRHHIFYYPDHHPSYHSDHAPLHALAGRYYPESYHRQHYYDKRAHRPVRIYHHELEYRERDRHEFGGHGHYPDCAMSHDCHQAHQRLHSPHNCNEDAVPVAHGKAEYRRREKSPASEQAGTNKALPQAEDKSASKHVGRKRKQVVPRRVMTSGPSFSSALSTDDDDDDSFETRRALEVNDDTDLRGSDFRQLHGRGDSCKSRKLDPNDSKMEASYFVNSIPVVGGNERH